MANFARNDASAVSWLLQATSILTARGAFSKNQRAIVKELVTENDPDVLNLARVGASDGFDGGLDELFASLNQAIVKYVRGLQARLGFELDA